MKVLITGATGFIGGATATAFARAGMSVSALVRPGAKRRLNPNGFEQVFQVDLSDSSQAGVKALSAAVNGFDVILHAAAIRDRWGTSSDEYCQTNVEGTLRLVRASLGRAGRLVYISSVGVMGDLNRLNIDETFRPGPYLGKVGYHQSKLAAESLVRVHANQIETVIVRPTITYGPGDEDGMLTRLIGLIARGRFVRVGAGSNFMHLMYIDDLTRGLHLAATHPAAVGGTYILAGPGPLPVSEIIGQIEQRLGKPAGSLALPVPPAKALAWGLESVYRAGRFLGLPGFNGTPPLTRDKIDTLCLHRGYSFEKAARELGYVPQVDYPLGLKRTLAWMADVGLLQRVARSGGQAAPSARVPK